MRMIKLAVMNAPVVHATNQDGSGWFVRGEEESAYRQVLGTAEVAFDGYDEFLAFLREQGIEGPVLDSAGWD